MKKVGLCLLVAMLVITLIGTTNAQGVKLGGKADSAKEITISGSIDLNTVYRDSGITSILDGFNNPLKQKSEFFITPLITLDFDIDVGDKVSAFARLENRQTNNTAGTASALPEGRLGNNNTNPAFRQAYVKVSEFISPDLNLTIGLQDLKLTLRKGEGAFFCDIANSYPLNGAWAGFTEFGGFTLNYGNVEKSNYAVGVFYGTIWETGVAHTDESLYGFHVDYKLPQGEKNMVKVLFAQSKLPGNAPGAPATYADASIMTMGAGVDYWAMPALEVYGEFYSQSGDLGKYWNATTGKYEAMGQSATAMRFGGQYDLSEVLNKPDLKPYAGLSYWSLSGDDGNPAKDNKDFISYSNVQSTLIMEDKLLGLGLDCNYTAIKVEAGITTSIDINKDGKGEELSVKLLLGQFTMATGIKYTPVTKYWGGGAAAAKAIDDALGQEIDIVTTLKYTESLSFTLGIGTVSGADFFEDTNGMNVKNAGMMMVTFDTKLKF